MSGDHKLTACRTRLLSQLERASAFTQMISSVMSESDDDELRQFHYQCLVVMLFSYFEEYLRCVVAVGAFWKAAQLRAHLGESHKDLEKFAVMPRFEVAKQAQSKVRFDERASDLKALFIVLVGGSPFPDQDTEDLFLDFHAVRNLIVHSGGLPTAAHVNTIKSSAVVIVRKTIGDSTFYRLRLSREFMAQALLTFTRCVGQIEHSVASDPAFRL